MNIGELIHQQRKALDLTLEDVAQRVGVGKSTVRKWEQGMIKNMRRDKIAALASVLQLDPILFVAATEQPDNIVQFKPKQRKDDEWAQPLIHSYRSAPLPTQQNVCKILDLDYVKPLNTPASHDRRMIEVIVYEDPAAAGSPLYAESSYERIMMPETEVPSKADFGIRILGNSMEPAILNGDIAWVRKQPAIENGEIGIFMLGDSAVCKRCLLSSNGKIKALISDNPAFESYKGEELREVRCVGKVLKSSTGYS